MTRTKATGQTCVGEVRLSPLDVGYDVRVVGQAVKLPKDFASVGIEQDGEVWLITGTREEMISAIHAAGYETLEEDGPG